MTHEMTCKIGGASVRGVVFVIQLYRNMLSPLRLPACRFVPTCSQYAVDALTGHGLIRGMWLTTVRLLKCGPWHRGGWDPIPEAFRRPNQVCDRQHRQLSGSSASGEWVC